MKNKENKNKISNSGKQKRNAICMSYVGFCSEISLKKL